MSREALEISSTIDNKISGFKAFNVGLTTSIGTKMKIGHTYSTEDAQYGKTGFHFCKRMEDTLRFFYGIDTDICLVTGGGTIVSSYDDYNGYYDMYSCTSLSINKKLTRQEIIEEALRMNPLRLRRFITGLALSEEEEAIVFDNVKLKYGNNEYRRIQELIEIYRPYLKLKGK